MKQAEHEATITLAIDVLLNAIRNAQKDGFRVALQWNTMQGPLAWMDVPAPERACLAPNEMQGE